MHIWLAATCLDHVPWEVMLYKTAMSMQVWPEEALEIQLNSSSLSESQTPSHREERSTSATADDKSDQHHAELQVRKPMTKQLIQASAAQTVSC